MLLKLLSAARNIILNEIVVYKRYPTDENVPGMQSGILRAHVPVPDSA